MADPNLNSDSIINSSTGVYTLDQAIDRMKLANTLPSGYLQFGWVNAFTGKRVSIGYNTGSSNIKLKP